MRVKILLLLFHNILGGNFVSKILVVDDNEQNCEILEDLLTTWGHDVYIAEEGTKALNLAGKVEPDVILLDVMLPGMNGFEICKKFKNSQPTQHTPIIMLTALNEVEDRIRGFNAGADVFLSRPVIYQELKNRVAWAINTKRSMNSMENIKDVVKSFLNIMKLNDENLYIHACNVKNYCEKVGKILSVTDDELKRLLIGAYLHDVGKVVFPAQKEHEEAGIDIIGPLKVGEWLKNFIRNHHEKKVENQMPLELKILITINRFVELWEQFGNKDTGVLRLSDECEKGYWSKEVLEAIKQVLKDEKFVKSINYYT